VEAAEVESLLRAVEHLHECRATYRESVVVREQFEGQEVWAGTVSVFSVDLTGIDTCYAWSSPIEGSDRRKLYAVLKIPPVTSPETAVQAAIVNDYKTQGNKNG
jgi:hypothetical protein